MVSIQKVRFLIESPENWQKKLKINVPFSGIPFYDCSIPLKGTLIFLVIKRAAIQNDGEQCRTHEENYCLFGLHVN